MRNTVSRERPTIRTFNGLPTFGITDLSTLGTTSSGILPIGATGSGNLPLDKQGRNIQLLDDLSWIKGRHTLKFGVDGEQVTLYGDVTLSARPTFDFTGVYTQNPQSRSGTGAGLADFLLGYVNDYAVSTRSDNENRQHTLEGYIQDDWKVSQKLTLNLGLRYELAMPWYETANHYADLILQPGPAYGMVMTAPEASQYGLRNSFATPDAKNFAPRVGLAYPHNGPVSHPRHSSLRSSMHVVASNSRIDFLARDNRDITVPMGFRPFRLSPDSSSPPYRTAGSTRGTAPAAVRGHPVPPVDRLAQAAATRVQGPFSGPLINKKVGGFKS